MTTLRLLLGDQLNLKISSLGIIYKTLERFDENKVSAIKEDSRRFLKALDHGEKV